MSAARAITAATVQHAVRKKLLSSVMGWTVSIGTVGGGVAIGTLTGVLQWHDHQEEKNHRDLVQQRIEQEAVARGGKIIYHYGSYRRILDIVSTQSIHVLDENYRIGSRAHNTHYSFPVGAYGTDIAPWNILYTQNQLSALFFGGNESRNVRWYVAFEQGEFYRLPNHPHQYVKQSPVGTRVPVKVVHAGPNLMDRGN